MGNGDVGATTPGIEVLSTSQIERIHLATLELLRRTGVLVLEPEARKVLHRAGCWVDDERVRFPSHLIEWAIRAAPSRIVLHSRDGEPRMFLEASRTYFGTGSDTAYTSDIETGERRKTSLEDIRKFARLVDALPNIDFHMCMGTAHELNQSTSDIRHFQAMAENTSKPICYTAWNVGNLQTIVHMCEIMAQGAEVFRHVPFAIHYCEPVSPLQHSIEGTQKLVYMAEHGLPVIYTPGILPGATSPVTIAGTLVVANAEVLSGLLLAQLVREGTPFVHGIGWGQMDMRYGKHTYVSPEGMIGTAAVCDICRHYELPTFGVTGCSDSQILDEQAAAEAALWIVMAALMGQNLAHDVGYLGSGLISCMEQVVIADELIGFVRTFMRGLQITDELLGLDVIDQVGPGGHFLGTRHTAKHFRECWFANLLAREGYEAWMKKGGKTLRQRAIERTREILEGHRPEWLPDEPKDRIEALIARREAHIESARLSISRQRD